MEFTFGVCTYNSGEYIIDTLESVRYQVVNYGKNIKTNLIIADDASSDETLPLAEAWADEYGYLFSKCRILTSDHNCGIAHNYSRLMDNIETSFFKTVDGDDLCSSVNIYCQIQKVAENRMGVFFPLRFNKDGIFVEESDYYNMFYYNKITHIHKKDLQMLELFKPFITPEVCFRREEYDDGVKEFVREYSQFEDDTSLYCIFKKNKNMVLDFIIEPMILYRVHNKSLSNGEESINQIKFLDDLHKFKVYAMKEEKNIIVKLFLCLFVFDTFRMKHRFSSKKSLYKIVAERSGLKRKKIACKDKDYSKYLVEVNRFIEEQTRHLIEIRNNSELFRNKFLKKSSVH